MTTSRGCEKMVSRGRKPKYIMNRGRTNDNGTRSNSDCSRNGNRWNNQKECILMVLGVSGFGVAIGGLWIAGTGVVVLGVYMLLPKRTKEHIITFINLSLIHI